MIVNDAFRPLCFRTRKNAQDQKVCTNLFASVQRCASCQICPFNPGASQ